jgi:hypothetical protein
VRDTLSTICYGPPDFFATRFNSRSRRAFGFWVVVAAIEHLPVLRRYVFYVAPSRVVALIPNYTTETPTDVE